MIDFMYTDNELIQKARQGDLSAEEELAKRYIKSVRICARPYFLAGGDSEDLIQEGMLGLLSAIRKYDCSGTASFKTYAEQCIQNRIISAIETAARFKHMPLNEGVSFELLEDVQSSGFHGQVKDVFMRQTEDRVIEKERKEELIIDKQNLLSGFEKQVLKMYLDGHSYKEIAVQLKKTEKSIDNAVQRIRKKFAQKK